MRILLKRTFLHKTFTLLFLAFSANLLVASFLESYSPKVQVQLVLEQSPIEPIEFTPSGGFPTEIQFVETKVLNFAPTRLLDSSFRLDFGRSANLYYYLEEVNLFNQKNELIYKLDSSQLVETSFFYGVGFEILDGILVLQTTTEDPVVLIDNPLHKTHFVFDGFTKLYTWGQASLYNALNLAILTFILSLALFRRKVIFNFVVITGLVSLILFVSKPFLNTHLETVGRDYFNGFSPYESTFVVFVLLVMLSLILMWSQRLPFTNYFPSNNYLVGNKSKASLCLNILLALAAGISGIYDATNSAQNLRNKNPIYDWDSTNVEYWRILIAKGQVPNRDFWYPYEDWYRIERWQPVSNSLYVLLLFFTVFFLLHHISDTGYFILPLKVMFVFSIIYFPGNSLRYLLPICVMLLVSKSIEGIRQFIVSTFFITILAVLSWVMWIYCVVALLLSFSLIELVIRHPSRRNIYRLPRLLFQILFSFTISILVSLQNHSFKGKLELLLSGGEITASGANGRTNMNFYHLNPRTLSLILIISLGLLCVRMISPKFSRSDMRLDIAILIYLFLITQKHLARDMYLWLIPVLLFVLCLLTSRLAQIINLGGFLSVVAWVLLVFLTLNHSSVLLDPLRNRFLSIPHYISDQVFGDSIAQKRATDNVLQSKSYSMQLWPKTADQYLSIPYEVRKSAAIFSNDSSLHLFAHTLDSKKVPWIADLWSLSPRSEQHRFIQGAQDKRYLLFDSRISTSDGVDNLVRLPLIANWIFQTFDLSSGSTYGPFYIYKKATTDDWLKGFSFALDFGSTHRDLPRYCKPQNIAIACPYFELNGKVGERILVTFRHKRGADINFKYTLVKSSQKVSVPAWLVNTIKTDQEWEFLVNSKKGEIRLPS